MFRHNMLILFPDERWLRFSVDSTNEQIGKHHKRVPLSLISWKSSIFLLNCNDFKIRYAMGGSI